MSTLLREFFPICSFFSRIFLNIYSIIIQVYTRYNFSLYHAVKNGFSVVYNRLFIIFRLPTAFTAGKTTPVNEKTAQRNFPQGGFMIRFSSPEVKLLSVLWQMLRSIYCLVILILPVFRAMKNLKAYYLSPQHLRKIPLLRLNGIIFHFRVCAPTEIPHCRSLSVACRRTDRLIGGPAKEGIVFHLDYTCG